MWDKCLSTGQYEDVFGGGGSGIVEWQVGLTLKLLTNLPF